MAKIRTVVCTKNNEQIIRQCLNSIFQQTYKDFICCIADDGSTDDTLRIIKEEYPQAKIYSLKESRGPSFNRNVVLKETTEEFVVFMDSDAFLDKNWFRRAIKRMEDENNVGAIGGKVFVGDTNKIQSVAGFFHRGGTCWLKGCVEGDNESKISERNCFWLPSSTFMMRTALARKIGGFDEDFCYLYEDMDICWRVWIAGYEVLYYSSLISHHGCSVTANKEYDAHRKQFMSKRNKIITMLKNYELLSLFRNLPFIFIVSFVEILLLKNKIAVVYGNIQPLFHFMSIWKKRKYIKTYRVKRDYELFDLFENNHLAVIKMCLGDVFAKQK